MPTRGITTLLFLVVGFTMTVGLHGCAAIPMAAVGASALEAGTGAVVKTGTEYTIGGSVERTFTIPRNAVRSAVLEAFDRAGIEVSAVNVSDDREEFEGQLQHRKVRVRVTPFSESLTSITLTVKRNFFLKDRATTSELLEQIEQCLAENPTFARRLRRPWEDKVATSPR
jgi:citrate lyase gamma subunit